MKYNGFELTEMIPTNWDGNTRQMLVWNDNDDICHLACVIGYTYIPVTINGFTDYKWQWICNVVGPWAHCADVPEEEPVIGNVEGLKRSLKYAHNALDLQNKQNEKLKAENEELKEKIKALQFERSEMARDVAWAVDNALIEKAVLDHPHSGHRITIIHELVEKKILEYTDKPKKKLRRMTYKELDDWLEQGKGVVRIANRVSNTISFDCEDRNREVSGYYKICGYDEDTWHYPMIEA